MARKIYTGILIFLFSSFLLASMSFPLFASWGYVSSGESQDRGGTPDLDAKIAEMVSSEYAPGEIIVRLREGASAWVASNLFSSHGFGAEQVDPLDPDLDIFLLRFSDRGYRTLESEMASFLRELWSDEDVMYAEPNYLIEFDVTPSDALYPEQWNLKGDTAGGIDAAAAWDIEMGNSEIIVAVIDSGLAGDMQDLAPLGSAQYVAPHDFVDGDNYPLDDDPSFKGYGHGTIVTGVINAMTNNDAGIAGVCWNNVKIMPLRILSKNSSVIDGFEWANNNGADVINCSFSALTSFSYALGDEIENAIDDGCTVVASAGNGDDYGNPESQVGYPASHEGVIAVGANNVDGGWVNHPEYDLPYRWGSNYGEGLDLLAPGDFVPTTVPGNFPHDSYYGPYYERVSGTSLSAPHVSAVSALLLSRYPDLTPGWIQNILRVKASRPPGYNDLYYGAGILNARSALDHDEYLPNPPVDDLQPVSSEWYFAEGCTGGSFEEYICVQNPGDYDALVEFVFMAPNEYPARHLWAVGAHSRFTLPVHQYVYGDVSVKLISNQEVFAERSMYWSNRREGHTCRGIAQPAFEWYLAEGSTRTGDDFDEWVLLMNPDDDTESVNVTFMRLDGFVTNVGLDLPPHSRYSMHVNQIEGFEDCDVSTKVTCEKGSEEDEGIIVERAMYWDRQGGGPSDAYGGHCAPGVNSGQLTWHLAEGSTRADVGFDEWVLIQNPGNSGAIVDITYMTPDGPMERDPIFIPAHSRQNIHVNELNSEPGMEEGTDVSVTVTSDKEVIAERAMYWKPPGYTEAKGPGHASEGISRAAREWHLAEGCTADGFETYVLLQNPNQEPINATMTFMTASGTAAQRDYVLGPESRFTEIVSNLVPNEYDVSTLVISDKPVIVERSMYWNSMWGGSDSVGIPRNLADEDTHTGSGVSVPLDGVMVTFEQVDSPGNTVVVKECGMQDPEDLGEFSDLLSQAMPVCDGTLYHVATTAAFSGKVEVKPTYFGIPEGIPEEGIGLFKHNEWSDTWMDITSQVSAGESTVSGECEELGTFCVGVRWSSLYSGAWYPQEPGISYDLSQVASADSSIAYAVGERGTILKTVDGGDNWNHTYWGPLALNGVDAVDLDNAWSVGDGGLILNTVDGGLNWSTLDSDVPQTLRDVDAVNSATAWAVGDEGVVLNTTNRISWAVQRPAGSGPGLNSVYAVNASIAWAVGDGGTILKTTDGGTTWSSQFSNVTQNLEGVSALDSSTAWAVGDTGIILKTTDGGATWAAQRNAGSGPALRSIYAMNSSVAWTAGDGGTILKTTDGGSSWSLQASNIPHSLMGICAEGAFNGWTVGENGTILKTTDGGSTWSAQDAHSVIPLFGVSALDDSTAYAAGDLGTILKTSDGGTTWTSLASGIDYFLFSICVADASNIWAVGDGGVILKTTDGGASWNIQREPGSGTQLISVSAVDALSAWAVSMSGEILRTIDGGDTWSIVREPWIGPQLMAVSAVDASTAWVVGSSHDQGGVIEKTTDGGVNWSSQGPGTDSEYMGIEALDNSTAWAAGYSGGGGTLLKTTDGGLNWIQQSMPGILGSSSLPTCGISAADSNSVWAVGFLGTAMHTSDGGDNWYLQWVGNLFEALFSGELPPSLWSVSAADADTAWATGWTLGEGMPGQTGYGLRGGVIYKNDAGPSIIHITPSGGVGDLITITGFDFGSTIDSSYVSFGGVVAAEYNLWSNDSIQVRVPEGVSGTVDVTVTNPAGTSNPMPFTVGYTAPIVHAIIPSTGTNDGMLHVIDLSGDNFQPGAVVSLSGQGGTIIQATNVQVACPTSITCDFDLSQVAVGQWDVAVENPDGKRAVLPDAFSVEYPAPAVSSITPARGASDGIVDITDLAGSNFLPGATARLKKEDAVIEAVDVDVVSPQQITCSLDLTGAEPGAYDVEVENPDGQEARLGGAFTVMGDTPGVTLIHISPCIGLVDGVLEAAELSGTDFQAGTSVWIEKDGAVINATDPAVVSDTLITCAFDLSGAEPGLWDIAVENPDGGTATRTCGLLVAGFEGPLCAWGQMWDRTYEVDIPQGDDLVAVSTSGNHALALRCDGSIATWGYNSGGQAEAPQGNDFVAVSAGGYHSLALRSDGSIHAWGENGYGQIDLPAGNDFVAVSAGWFYSLALRSDGSLVACGQNDFGQTDVPSGSDFKAISAGGFHALALHEDGSISAWGSNDNGQLEGIPQGGGYIAISGGGLHSMALLPDGSLSGWGDNYYGQADVPAGNDFVNVAAGGYHSIARRSDGSASAWGRNDEGQTDVPAGIYDAVCAGGTYNLAIGTISITVVSITPSAGENDGVVGVEISGTNFQTGATVALAKQGETVIQASDVLVTPPDKIACSFDLTGLATGVYDVVVENPDGQSAILAGGFTVNAPPAPCGSGGGGAIFLLGIMLGLLSIAGTCRVRWLFGLSARGE
jgi:photosystem II stability/assembly factor-like uncharacterized protein